jgi:YhcH/YjgK/YiaL family protein
MIIDILQNARLYQGLNEKFRKAFDYLQETDFSDMQKGIYTVDGDNIFAIVNEFETKDKRECKAEVHRKHIDIQYIVRGAELIGYAPFTTQKPVVDYDEAHDVALFVELVSFIKLEAGMFVIFYPNDLHQPEVREFEPVLVKKVVVKIKI